MRCPTCGYASPAGQRFCGNCGGALAPLAVAPEERKLVTVFFADVVATTQLLTALDPEQLREQIAEFFRIAREEIEHYGGTVEKFIGDAVMAVFGLPHTHEDDPERSVRTALAVHSRLRRYVEAGRLPEVRIGINTGEVVANPQAADKGEFLVTGEAVNLAARLQQSAIPGQVLVGESTYAATDWTFDYRKLPPFDIKGKQEKVIAYEFLGLRRQPLPVARQFLRGISSPLVGRNNESAALIGRIDQLLAGLGGIVGVIGEAGIGKSRLLAEVRRQVADRDLLWLEGSALSFSQTISYRPFLEIFKSASGITEYDNEVASWTKLENRVTGLFADQVREILPYLATLLGLPVRDEWEDRVKYLDAESIGRQIYRSSRLFFERLAQERPVVLAFGDLHWMDESSVGLLLHMFPLVSKVPLLLCGLSRPEPGTPAARLRKVAREEYAEVYTEIVLAPLAQAESVQLIQNLLQIKELNPGTQELLLEKTEGNPFFVEEVIRTLIDMKVAVRDENTRGWCLSPQIRQITIPDTLRGLVIARVDRLAEDVKEVLKVASVIGRSFFYRVLRAIAETAQDLDRHLAELQEHELIREKTRIPELEYIFKHALTQEGVYESILLRRRRELHVRVGETIEVLFADRLEEFYALLAYHYARAEDWEKAQYYLVKAGDQAGKVAADAEALAYYRQALAAFSRAFGDRWDPFQRAVLERKMGEALFRRGEHQQAADYLQRALAYLGSPLPASRWGIRLAIIGQLVQQAGHRLLPDLFIRHTDDRPHPAAEERARIYDAMGWIDYFVDVNRLILDALMLLNVSERNHFSFGMARGSMALGLICELIPVFWLARHYHRRAIALAEQIQHPLAVGLAYLGLGLHELRSGDTWEKALEHLQQSASAYREAGELRRWGAATTMVAWVSCLRGDISHSLEKSEEVLRVGQDAADPEVWGWGLAQLGETLWLGGAMDEAVPHLQKAIVLFKSIPDDRWWVIASSRLGQCYLRQGKLQDALTVLEDGYRLINQRGFGAFLGTAPRIGLAEAYLVAAEQAEERERVGYLRMARQICREALKQSKIDIEALPRACRIQGTHEWLSGKRTTAHHWWRRSCTVAERLGARYDLGVTYLEMGQRTGEGSYLERAETIFTEIGARFDLARVKKLRQTESTEVTVPL